jgi:putative peptidoglycan lipid II flippase
VSTPQQPQRQTLTSKDRQRTLLGSSAVMAAGTVVSRLSGFLRGLLLVAALGAGLHADVFNIANTVPNMLYVLLAGGVVNAVLVPQLVRAMKQEPDGGEAYTNRIVTLAGLFLGGVTVLLVAGAPWLMRLFLDDQFYEPELAAQLDSVVAFARYCLPQVFFYGMFVLLGQVLNARGRFGPMMWAPIANNVVAVAILATYLLTYGPASDAEKLGGYTGGQEALLGIGSTVGIVVQLLVLLPYLRAAGVRYRPRFDFRGSGLGHTLRLGLWTVLFVIVNQIAYTVVVRLASSGTASGASTGDAEGTGYTVYSNAYLLTIVPHSIITVSLATAVLPLLSSYAAEGDLTSLGRQVSSTLRSALALVVPVAVLLSLTALDVADVVWGWGSGADDFASFAPSLALFGLGLVFFTAHYLALRGFYALEQTRRVFWIQCVIAATNIVAAILLTRGAPPVETAPRLVLAYAAAYGVGVVVSYTVLRRTVGDLSGRLLVRFLVRLVLAVGLAALVGWGVRTGLAELVPASVGTDKLGSLLALGVIGLAFGLTYLLAARVLRLTEVVEVVSLVTGRLRRRRSTT